MWFSPQLGSKSARLERLFLSCLLFIYVFQASFAAPSQTGFFGIFVLKDFLPGENLLLSQVGPQLGSKSARQALLLLPRQGSLEFPTHNHPKS